MAAASPYRIAAPTSAPAPPKNPFRPRLFRPTAHGLAIVASLIVHGVVLTASALSASKAPPPAEEDTASRFHTGAFVLHAEDFPVFCNWPPPPEVADCFDRATLLKANYFAPRFNAYGTEATTLTTSTSIPYPLNVYDDPETASYQLDESLRECARTAREGGWSGDGRVFVRVAQEKGKGVIAQALPLDEAANHPGLLCCLRHSQLPVASTMRPDSTVRYTFSTSTEQGITLSPPPL